MKIHRVDDLHVCVRSNEGASVIIYETLEIAFQGFAERWMSKQRGC